MEGYGIPGRVHVSKTTADELLTHGKGNWLTPREDRIVAKGKGEMETFFVFIPAHAATTATSSDSRNMPTSLPAISDNSSWHVESDRLDSEKSPPPEHRKVSIAENAPQTENEVLQQEDVFTQEQSSLALAASGTADEQLQGELQVQGAK